MDTLHAGFDTSGLPHVAVVWNPAAKAWQVYWNESWLTGSLYEASEVTAYLDGLRSQVREGGSEL
jgi:hypothetical protein